MLRQVDANDAEWTGRGNGDGQFLPVTAGQFERDALTFVLHATGEPVEVRVARSGLEETKVSGTEQHLCDHRLEVVHRKLE